MLRSFAVFFLVLACPFAAAADTLPAGKETPAARFFPINPSAYMRPITRNPYMAAPPKPASQKKSSVSAKDGAMTEEQARQILSIYPVHN